MYSKIVHPTTGRKVSVKSRLGKRILRNYLFILSGGAASSSDCSSCLEAIESDSEFKTTLECGHNFHTKCIVPWVIENPTCPMCRGSALTSKIKIKLQFTPEEKQMYIDGGMPEELSHEKNIDEIIDLYVRSTETQEDERVEGSFDYFTLTNFDFQLLAVIIGNLTNMPGENHQNYITIAEKFREMEITDPIPAIIVNLSVEDIIYLLQTVPEELLITFG